MPAPLILRILGDASSYLKTAEATIATNAKLASSFTTIGPAANLSAEATVAAAVKSIRAQEAQLAGLQAIQARTVAGSRENIAATVALADVQARLNRSLGVSTAGLGRTGAAARTAERDLSKMTRGVLAGSGVLSRFGRSLAFASGGFLGFALGATLVARSISGAEDLAKAQESLAIAIQHTHGNLAVLLPEYNAIAKAAARFGQSETDALTGLARATVLTGNAAAAQRAYQEALVISKATGKDFNSVLIATAKGQEGITTSLRRYGILVATTSTGTEQFTQVMQRFGGQAEANTTASDRLHAAVANFEATLGQALLPTFDHLATRFTAWLQHLEQSGQLQRDVNGVVTIAGGVFHALGSIIGFVDKVTGSFANTLKLLLVLKVSSVLLGWSERLGIVAAAETEATAATVALAEAQTGLAASSVAANATAGGLLTRLGRLKAIGQIGIVIAVTYEVATHAQRLSNWLFGAPSPGAPSLSQIFRNPGLLGSTPNFPNPLIPTTGIPFAGQSPATNRLLNPLAAPASRSAGFAAGASPITQWASFRLTLSQQIEQAKAALTTSTADDVAVAKQIIARIKRAIDRGHLHGSALIQALQDEASALGTIQSAAASARQAAAAAKAKADAAATTYNIPIELQVAQASLDAYGKDTTGVLKRIIAAAQAAITSGKKRGAGLVAAYGVIQSAQQQLDAQLSAIPANLQLQLAREQALGTDQTGTLKKMKTALERALLKAKGNIEAQTAIWNEIANINQQLGSSATSALGGFKQLNIDKIAKGLHLTSEQAKKLKAQLSQVGPGGTVPGTGVGAYGYRIGPGGTVAHHHHHHHVSVDIDGKQVESSVRHHRRRRLNRNSSQRRGPNAGGEN